ncbi:MAG: VanZ family protein [Candidatus Manganitrophaceae bacterium]|nr:MAG: VanZ family protein [Candidatus Manganitrophaceae bacterium]
MRRVCSIGLVFYLLYLGAVTLAPFDFQFGSQLHRWERSIALSPPNVAANILLFIPLGGLLYGLLPAGRKEPRLIGVLLFSGVVSLTVESLQLFLPERFSSFSDLLVNTIGGGVGFLLFKAMEAYARFLHGRLPSRPGPCDPHGSTDWMVHAGKPARFF